MEEKSPPNIFFATLMLLLIQGYIVTCELHFVDTLSATKIAFLTIITSEKSYFALKDFFF